MLLITFLIVVMGVLRGMKKPNGYLFDIEFILNFILNTALLFSWLISIYTRIIHKKIRGYLLWIGVLMFFWLFIRTIKYRVLAVFPNMNVLWYLYYVPIVLIPLLSYYTARTVGQREDAKLSRKDRLLLIPAGIIILCILTNDFHRMAFVFEGNTRAGMTYGYGPFYYLSYLFSFSFAVCSILIMFRKSRVKESKRRIYLPFIIVFFYILYSAFYNFNQNHPFLQFIEITIAYCMTTILFWESCIQIGLIRSNSNYREFFKSSTSNTLILDEDGNLRYSTGEGTIDRSTFELLKKNRTISPNAKTRLYINKITGGYVLREEKLDYLLSLIEELETINRKTEEEILLLQNRMKIDEKRIKLQEKNRLYDIIRRNTEEQMNRIRENLTYLTTHGNEEEKWQEINILATYVKRYSNLVFLSESNGRISMEELRITIAESLNNLKKMGIHEGLKTDVFGDVSLNQAFQIYHAVQKILEHSFQRLRAIYVVLRHSEEEVRLSILLHGEDLKKPFLEETWFSDLSRDIQVTEEDRENIQIDLRFHKE